MQLTCDDMDQHTRNAIAYLVFVALGKKANHGKGHIFLLDDISFGDQKVGDWQVELRQIGMPPA